MELSKYIPPQFERGDLVMLSNDYIMSIHNMWISGYNNSLAIILNVHWDIENLSVKNLCQNSNHTRPFHDFKLIKKNCKLCRLLL